MNESEDQPSEPVVKKILATAPLNMRVGHERPAVHLVRMSDDGYRVFYDAWNSRHETRFTAADHNAARSFFERITGQSTRPSPRPLRPPKPPLSRQ